MATGTEKYRDMLALRRRLLREPLGLDFTAVELEAERRQIHLALDLNGALAGTLLLVPPDTKGTAKLRQMAVEPSLQRQGFGSLLVGHGEDLLGRLGATTIALSARLTAVSFYQALGYRTRGDAFIEVTIPHERMEKQVGSNGFVA